MPKINDREWIKVRKEEAAHRREARANATPEQQLAALDERLGKGKGATKERARLHALINGSD